MAEAAQRATERERGGGAAARAHGIPAPAEATPEALPLPGAESRHAALLADPRMGELGAAQRARLMRQLQRGGGNSYAERVVSRAQATAARLAPRPSSTATTGAAEAAVAEEPQETAGLAAPLTARAVAPAPPAAGEPTVRRSWVGNAFNAVAGAVSGDGLLRTVAGLARNLPGYSMLGLVLGRDPISGDAIDRSPKNVLRAVMGLVPVVGEQLFLAMDEAGAIDKAFAWADEQLKQLGLNFDLIKATFKKAWDALSLKDAITNPGGTWDKLKGIFLEPINKIKSFVGAALEKVKEFIFEAVMERLGGGPVMGLLQKAGGAFNAIIKDPIGFVGNLISGVGQGLKQFGANILTHLKKGLFSWLFGEMGAAGIQLPKSFDLSGILDLVLQVLGMTWGFLRGQAAKVLGEPVVQKAESAFKIFVIVKEQGVGGLWEFIKEQLGNLKEMVFDAVKDLVASQVIQAGIQWLVGVLGGPAGAIVKAIKAIYDVVMWFVNNASRIMALVNSIGDSIGAIAAGALGQAAGFIERSLADSIPVLIGFLANLIGLGGLSQKIRGVIEKLQAPVKKAVGFVLGKLKTWAKKLWGKVKGVFGRPKNAAKSNSKGEQTKASALAEMQSKAKSLPSLAGFSSLRAAILSKYRPQGLRSITAKVSKGEVPNIVLSAKASPASKATMSWEEVFAKVTLPELQGELEEMKPDFAEQGFQTHGMLSVDGEPVGSREKNGPGDLHAEDNLLAKHWSDALARAASKANALQKVGGSGERIRIVMMLNRTPCPRCSARLIAAVSAAKKQFPVLEQYAQFTIAATGVYEPSEPLSTDPKEQAAAVERQRREYAKQFSQVEFYRKKAQKLGIPVAEAAQPLIVKAVTATRIVKGLTGATRMKDLRALKKAGWDLKVLQVNKELSAYAKQLRQALVSIEKEFDKQNK